MRMINDIFDCLLEKWEGQGFSRAVYWMIMLAFSCWLMWSNMDLADLHLNLRANINALIMNGPFIIFGKLVWKYSKNDDYGCKGVGKLLCALGLISFILHSYGFLVTPERALFANYFGY